MYQDDSLCRYTWDGDLTVPDVEGVCPRHAEGGLGAVDQEPFLPRVKLRAQRLPVRGRGQGGAGRGPHLHHHKLVLHGGIQDFLSNGCIGCIYLVKILAHCAMLQCMSRYNKPP